jgi:2'-5' RNA ligase
VRSALLIPVLEAESAVHDLRSRHDPSAVVGIPAHVTVLFPFLPVEHADDLVLAGLRELFALHPPFEFRLTRTARFPRTLYLPPEPEEPFRSLTEAVFHRFPDFPPYEGRYDDVVPHLTVADLVDPSILVQAETRVARALPIVARADAVWLMAENEHGRWTLHTRFSLGA